MELKELSSEQLTEIYDQYMVIDFPQDELKPLERILYMLRTGLSCAYGIYEGRELRGYATFIVPDGLQYGLLDYLAVIREYRGTGVCTRLLDQGCLAWPTAFCCMIFAAFPMPQRRSGTWTTSIARCSPSITMSRMWTCGRSRNRSVSGRQSAQGRYGLLRGQLLYKMVNCLRLSWTTARRTGTFYQEEARTVR